MSPSIVSRVTRTYLGGLALAAASIVVVSAVAFSVVVMWRDDQDALALGHLLAQELDDHVDNPASFDRVVRHELAEQHWFARRIEVWSGQTRYGGPASEGTLRALATQPAEACAITHAAGLYERVCVVHAGMGASIVIASEVVPMLADTLPLLGVVAAVALAMTILFSLLGRRRIAESLAPLSRFEAEIAAIPARASSRSVPRAWGASEIDSLAATFDAMLARIDEATLREQRFVADAAHELRTPLTRLRMQLELAREELREGKSIDPRLGAAVRTAIELADTTEALLAMAREDAGKTEPVELADVVDAVSMRLDDDARGRVRTTGGEPAIAAGVEALLALATSNLIDNALKYATGTIEVGVVSEGERVVLRVTDTGPGIPDDELSRIRTPFVRGRSSEGTRGAGLGLALVDHVARLHGGSLALENRAEGGLRAVLAVRRWQSVP